MPAELLDQRGRRPYKTAGMVLIAVAAVALGLLFGDEHRGDLLVGDAALL